MTASAAKTASHVMSPHVVCVGETDSLQDAMRVMTEQHVSGVPVVDRADRCVGVISTSDIVSFIEADQEEHEGEGERSERWFNPETQKWEESMFTPEMLGEYDSVPVSEAMTSDPLTVGPGISITEVARMMIENDVHRVFVVDDSQKLQGVISSFDFVALVAEG